MPHCGPPHARTLHLDVASIVKNRKNSTYPGPVMQWNVVHVYGLRAEVEKFTHAFVAGDDPIHQFRRRTDLIEQVRALCQHLIFFVVNDYARESLPVSESLDDMAQLLARPFLQTRFDDLLQTLRQYFGPTFQVGAQSALLPTDFILGNDECDDAHGRNQKQNQPKT